MIPGFRIVAILEGFSYLALVFFAMPLKYWGEYGLPNKVIGMAHGILFIIFIVLAAVVCYEKKWPLKTFVGFLMASLLPFGTFYLDQEYLKKLDPKSEITR